MLGNMAEVCIVPIKHLQSLRNWPRALWLGKPT
jgi:hypothetical protein